MQTDELMAENKMEQVAALFNKKMYEPFEVQNSVDKRVEIFRFSPRGMEHFSPGYQGSICIKGIKGEWYHSDYALEPLILGTVWIKELVEQGTLF